jgi:hypothetical protein
MEEERLANVCINNLAIFCTFQTKYLLSALSRIGLLFRGPILAWIVILSVYGADTVAIDLSLSALIS